MNYLVYIALGGACGAVARYVMTSWVSKLWVGHLPLGTLLVNILGCAAAGIAYVIIVERHLVHPNWQAVVMIGFLGAFTTFSAFSVETITLFEAGHVLQALLYAIASTVTCVLVAGVAVQVTRLALS
jgi:CrcB protein